MTQRPSHLWRLGQRVVYTDALGSERAEGEVTGRPSPYMLLIGATLVPTSLVVTEPDDERRKQDDIPA